MWEGTVVSIHVAAEASAAMQSITEVRAFPGRGLEGDRYFYGTGFYSKKSSYGGREVTLIEIEAVQALFGAVLMRGTRLCEPCKHLDDLTLHGVMSGLIHRGGLRALILSEGVIRVRDAVRPKSS
jgi:hypothetical protein